MQYIQATEVIMKKTGILLKHLRENNDLTQAELAMKCHLHSQYVSNWERGKCYPPKNIMPKLNKALKLSKKDKQNLKKAVIKEVIKKAERNFKGLL